MLAGDRPDEVIVFVGVGGKGVPVGFVEPALQQSAVAGVGAGVHRPGPPRASDVRVVEQEDTDERDIGLVVVSLLRASGSIYLEPVGYDEPLWRATVELDETL